MNTRAKGGEGESLAEAFLVRQNWRILGRNLHMRFGEIDILAESPDAWLVIVEVKAKRTARKGFAVEMVTPAKQRVLRQLAKLVQSRYNKPVRVDVVAIDNFGTDSPDITHYPFAITD